MTTSSPNTATPEPGTLYEVEPSRRIQRSHGGWLRLLDPCLLFARQPEVCQVRTPDVSTWSVGEQLEHLLLADRSILRAVNELVGTSDDPGGDSVARGRPTFIGRVILWTGFIPRGRGQAPDFAKPSGMSADELADGLGAIRDGVQALAPHLRQIERNDAVRRHPAGLGSFTAAQWLRFAFVHHVHHAKIIRDILKAATPV